METLGTLAFAVVGSVEFVRRIYNKDYESATIILVAAIVGAVLGPQVQVTWFTGLVTGLSASGIVTAVSKING